MHKMHTKWKLSLPPWKAVKETFTSKWKTKSNVNNCSHHSTVLLRLLPLYKEESSDQLSLCPCFLPERKTVSRDFYWMTDFFMHVNLPTGWLALFQNNHYHITLCKYSISTQTTPFHPVHTNLPEEKGSYIVDIRCAHASADVSCFGRECFFDCNCLCRRTDPT